MRKIIRSRYTVSRERTSRPQNISVYALKFQLYTLSFRILNLTMETNVDEAPEVEATSSKSNKGKKLIPWRDPVKGPILKTAMFKLALTSSVETNKIYFKSKDETRDMDKRWQEFQEALFKQPEFEGLEGGWRTIREQWTTAKKERAKHHGWLDANGGITGNLSNHAGDLCPLDKAIKDCLMDLEQLNAEKDLKKDLGPELNEKEGTLIQTQLSKESKSKRKENTLKYKVPAAGSDVSSDSNTSSNKSSRTNLRKTADDRIVEWLFSSNNQDGGPSNSKKQRRGGEAAGNTSVPNAQREKDLLRKLNMLTSTVEHIVDNAVMDHSCIDVLNTVTVEYMVNVFCCYGEGDELNPKEFKSEMEAYGLSKLDAGKLFLFLRNVSTKPVQEWEAEYSLPSLDDIMNY